MTAKTTGTLNPQRMSEQAFAALGAGQVAYIKPVEMNGVRLYGLFHIDGEALATAPTREIAAALARQHGFEAVSLH